MLIDLCGQHGVIKLTNKVIEFAQVGHIVFTKGIRTAKTDYLSVG
jgi:hypothetical protein